MESAPRNRLLQEDGKSIRETKPVLLFHVCAMAHWETSAVQAHNQVVSSFLSHRFHNRIEFSRIMKHTAKSHS